MFVRYLACSRFALRGNHRATVLTLLACLALLTVGQTPALAYSVPPQNIEIAMVDPDPTDNDPTVDLLVTFTDINGEVDYTVEESVGTAGVVTTSSWTVAGAAGQGATLVAKDFQALPNTEYCYLITANYNNSGPGRGKLTCAVTPAMDKTLLWRAEVETTVVGSGTNHPVDVRLRYGGGRQGPQEGGLTHVYTSRDHFPDDTTTRFDLMTSDVASTDDITELYLAPRKGQLCLSDVELMLNEQLAFRHVFPTVECFDAANPLRFSGTELRDSTFWADFAASNFGPQMLAGQSVFFTDLESMLDAYLGHQLVNANLSYGDDFLSWSSGTTVTEVDTWGGRVALGLKVSGYGTSADFEAAFNVRPEWICEPDVSKLSLGLTVDSFNADFGLLIDVVLAVIGGVGADDVEDFLLGLLCGAWETEVGGEYLLMEIDVTSSLPSICSFNNHEVNFFPDSMFLFAPDPRPVGPGSCECGSVRLEEPCEIQFNACNPGYYAECNESYPDSPQCGGCTCVPDLGLCPSPPEEPEEPTGSCECEDGAFGNVCTSASSNSCGPGESPVCIPSTSDEEACGGCECVPTPEDDPEPPAPSDTCGCGNSGLGNVCISEYDDCAPGKHPVCTPLIGDPPFVEDGVLCGGCVCAS